MGLSTALKCYHSNTADNFGVHSNIREYLKDDTFVNRENRELVLEAFETGKSGIFSYKDGHENGIGYVVPLESTGWVLVHTFPAKVTGQMYREAVGAGVFLLISLTVLFLIIAIIMLRNSRKEQKRLLKENTEMDYVIHGALQFFDCFVLVDIEDNTYRYLLDGEPSCHKLGRIGSYKELVDCTLDTIMEDNDWQRLHDFLEPENLQKNLSNGIRELKLEYKSKLNNGSWRRFNVACVERKKDKPVKVLIAVQDITDIKRSELESQKVLKDAMEEAERANKAKSTFLFNMSHDIRTPMNAIIGFANLADKQIDDKIAVRKYIEKIRRSSDVLLKIINDVLDLARIESGKSELLLDPHNLVKDMTDVRDMFAESMQNAGLKFDMEVEVTDEISVYDDLRMSQIIINLLSNAQKFTSEGGSVIFRIEQFPDATNEISQYRFIVRDSGIGMSEEFIGHMFDTFEREHTSTVTGIEGTGLGLSIVKKLVDMMDGKIYVHSVVGEGTEFIIDIPLRIVQPGTFNEQQKNDKRHVDLAGRRVLVVDDNDMNLEIARSILEDVGMIVHIADNGQQAIKMLLSKEDKYYDLILMDLQMPVMNGYEATRKIRTMSNKVLAETPIIAITANAFEEDRKQALDAGMNGFVAKPLNVEALWAVMGEVLQPGKEL